jgi:predicted transcriptional regulator
MARARLTIDISEELAKLISDLAEESDTTKADIIRRGLAVMKAVREQKKVGREHLGFVRNPEKLDAELLGVMP